MQQSDDSATVPDEPQRPKAPPLMATFIYGDSSSEPTIANTQPYTTTYLPDGQPTLSSHDRLGKPPKSQQVQRNRNIIIGIIIALLTITATSGYLFLASRHKIAVTMTANTATPYPPTSTTAPGQPSPTPYPTMVAGNQVASSATVTFTRSAQTITSATPTLTAAIAGGTIGATTQNASESVGSTQTAAIDAPQTGFGVQVSFTINVTNNNPGGPISVAQGVIVSGTDSSGNPISCGTVNTGATVSPLPTGATTTQLCWEPEYTQLAATYNVTIGGFFYFGNAPAGGSPPFWTVPGTCVNDNLAAAQSAVRSKLQADLQAMTPSGNTVFYTNYAYSDSSAVCIPMANTKQYHSFSYVVSDPGMGTETYYSNAAVQAFEGQQLQKEANNVAPAGSWQLLTAQEQICGGGGGTVSAVTSSSVTITCNASGTIVWNWGNSQLNALAKLIAGKDLSSATSIMNSTAGIAGGVSIALSNGSSLPTNAQDIKFMVNG